MLGTVKMRSFEQPWFFLTGGIASLAAMVAGLPVTFLVLFGMMGLDIFVGLLRAGMAGEINSKKAWDGGIRKTIMIAVLGSVYLIQIAIASATTPYIASHFPDLSTNLPLTEIVASYYIVYFLISILENAVAAGVPLPDILVQILKIDPNKRSSSSIEKKDA